jgi:polysaccharide export outer membrane protein
MKKLTFHIRILTLILFTSGCTSSSLFKYLPSSGASESQIENASNVMKASSPSIHLIDVNNNITQRLLTSQRSESFAHRLPQTASKLHNIGTGDMLEVSIWEAPPATLFGASTTTSQSSSSSQVTVLPEQMVTADGTIQVPFAGKITAAGRSTQEIQDAIIHELTGKAHDPQVLVRVKSNESSNVTVVGEVNQSQSMPLTSKGERLLDALAASGGSRQPVDKVMVQITRSSKVLSMPLERVIQEPEQNIELAAGDVITLIHQPVSFTVLGAAGKNAEIDFEAKGISLSQALARAGGVLDNRADAHGVFVFRFEDAYALGNDAKNLPHNSEGKIPVVYRLNLEEPTTFLIAQNFPMKNKDVLYISDAPSTEIQKFLSILTSSLYSIDKTINVGN